MLQKNTLKLCALAIWEAATFQPGLNRSGFGRWRQRCHCSKKQNKTKKPKKMQESFFFFFSVVAQFIQPVYPDFYFMLLYVEINQIPHIMTLFFTINSRKEKTLFSRDFICCFYPPFRDKKPLWWIWKESKNLHISTKLTGLRDKNLCNALNPIRTTNSYYNNTLLQKNIAALHWPYE